jgi:hypothetical protein
MTACGMTVSMRQSPKRGRPRGLAFLILAIMGGSLGTQRTERKPDHLASQLS